MTFRYTLTNQSDESVTLISREGSGCVARLRFEPDIVPHACIFNDTPYLDFAPYSSRNWVWQVLPSEQGLPAVSGEQDITGFTRFFDVGEFPATTSFSAPQYLGGRLSISLADGVTLNDVEDVMLALNAVVIDSLIIEPSIRRYTWQISGTTLEEARAAYSSDPRFRSFSPSRSLPDPQVIYTVDDEDGARLPSVASLTAAYPNPFAASTSFALTVPESGPARVEIFDVLGRRVAVLHDGPLAAGPEHRFTFHAAALPSGLYVVRATGDEFSQTRRITLSR